MNGWNYTVRLYRPGAVPEEGRWPSSRTLGWEGADEVTTRLGFGSASMTNAARPVAGCFLESSAAVSVVTPGFSQLPVEQPVSFGLLVNLKNARRAQSATAANPTCARQRRDSVVQPTFIAAKPRSLTEQDHWKYGRGRLSRARSLNVR